MPLGRGLRSLARTVAGRDSSFWRSAKAPRLRYWAFRDLLDAAIYALLSSRGSVFAVQIGAYDGRRNDPLWPFRSYPNLRGLLVEPFDHAFRALERNYAPFRDRFALAQVAVSAVSGRRPFYSLADPGGLPTDFDQLGTLDEALLRKHVEAFPGHAASVNATSVRCVTLRELYAENGVERIDLLLIDAEGEDYAILSQADLEHRPVPIVVFEHCHLTGDQTSTARTRLADAGYRLLACGSDTLALHRDAGRTVPGLAALTARS